MYSRTKMQQPSLFKHIRDIIALPFTVTVIVPYFIHNPEKRFFTTNDILIQSIGVLLASAGVSLFLYTVYLFKTFGSGTLAPWTATKKLVIRGPYKYCRNPMITGVLFILMGETLFLQSRNILIWTITFFFINTIYFILKEEPDLEKRFGEPYKKYKAKVPRWIPSINPYDDVNTGS